MTGSPITAKVRAAVRARHHDRCARCGRLVLDYDDYSLQHRRARGAGGSSRPETNRPGNLVFLCGSATTGCHGWVESHRTSAQEFGFTLFQACDVPAEIPVRIFDVVAGGLVWVRLTDNDDASMVFVPEQEAVAVMVAAGYIRKEVAS